MVVTKPASIPVHHCGQYRKNTVVGLLAAMHGITDVKPLHRLDRPVSGASSLASTVGVIVRITQSRSHPQRRTKPQSPSSRENHCSCGHGVGFSFHPRLRARRLDSHTGAMIPKGAEGEPAMLIWVLLDRPAGLRQDHGVRGDLSEGYRGAYGAEDVRGSRAWRLPSGTYGLRENEFAMAGRHPG